VGEVVNAIQLVRPVLKNYLRGQDPQLDQLRETPPGLLPRTQVDEIFSRLSASTAAAQQSNSDLPGKFLAAS